MEIDKNFVVKKLIELGAEDLGETMLEEVIIYDKDLKWKNDCKLMRIRKKHDSTHLTFKHHNNTDAGEAVEIEVKIDDMNKAIDLLKAIGYVPFRRQQKKRHTLKAFDVTFDIDTWPKLPPYIEVEGPSLEHLKKAAEKIGFDWSKAVFKDARWVIEQIYKIPVSELTWFTFDRFE